MANKTPIRAVFNDSNIATGLSEFQSGDTISHTHGGTGLSSLGSAGQVIKVNDAGNALEFGTVSGGGGGSQNLFSTIAVSGQSNIAADGTTDTLTFAAGSGITLTTDASSDTLTVTSSITQYADSDARGAISVTDSGGDGSLSYNNSTGVLTYTGPSAAEVRAHLSAGNGITLSSGAISIASGAITNAMLAGSIAASKLSGSIGNSKLSNSSITIGSDSVSLGGTQTDLNGITSLDVDNITIDGNSITSTDTNGNISITPNGTGKVILDGLSFPTSDGTTGQVLRTDGSGNITFATVSGGSGEANQNAFSTISVSGQSDIAADSTTDTLTLAAGSNITLTTNASNDTVTITSTASGSVSEAFKTISVSGQDDVVADGATDTLTIAAGTGMTVTTTAGTDTITFATTAITSVAADTSPQLGGDLDVNGNSIVSTSNANIQITPNGTGKVRLDGNVDIQSGEIILKNSGSVSNIKLYCESSNAHYTQLQSAAHSAYSGNITLTLPTSTGNLIGTGDSGTVTNTMLAGSIAASKLAGSIGNSKLSNSSITIGSDSISLGGTQTDLNGITSLDVDNITIDGNVISSTNTNGNITLTPNGTGKVILKGITYPASDGTNGQAIVTDGSGNLSFSTISGGGSGIASLAADTSPELGGNLDVVTHSIVSSSNRDINITPNGSGKVVIDGLSFPTSDGSADQVLKTDGSGNLSFVNQSGGGGSQNLFSTIAVSGQSNVVADATSDTLTLVGAGDLAITTNASTDTITFTSSANSTVTENLRTDVGVLALRTAIADNAAAYSLTKYHINTFETDTGFTKTNVGYDSTNEVYSTNVTNTTDITGSDSDSFDDSDFRVSTGGTVTLTATITSGLFHSTTGDTLIDGSGDSTANQYFNGNTVGATVTFDAGANKKIDWQGIRIITSSATDDQGTFVAEASNDNSSFTTLKSAFTLQTMTGTQRNNGGSGREATWSNSTGYRYFRLRRTAGSGNSSPWVYHVGFKWTTLFNVTASSAGNMITTSAIATTGNVNVTSMDAILLYRDVQGTNTLNTDLILKVSADNGSNYTTTTLTAAGNYDSTFKIAKANNVTVTSGNQLKYQILWANQSSGSKEFTVKGIALQYDDEDGTAAVNASTLTVAGITYPTSDGSNGQALITNGSGTLSFGDVSAGTAPTVTAVNGPLSGGTDQTLTITGTGFAARSTVSLISGSNGVITNITAATTFTSATSISTTINVLGDTYYVRVENPDGLAGISSSALLTVTGSPATGGTRSNPSGNTYIHTYTSSGTLVTTSAISNVEVLVVGGGGAGGGNYRAGGGGAGGFRTSVVGATSGGGASAETRLSLSASTTYTVTVGAGGAGVTNDQGGNGGDSVISGSGITTVTSVGGGGGGQGYTTDVAESSGTDGGCGGGAGSRDGNGTGGNGTANQGYGGGDSAGANEGSSGSQCGGGGGGAGAAGNEAGPDATDGDGGVGVQSSISGSATYYAGGGGGGNYSAGNETVGGNGGGADGGEQAYDATAIAGTANTGGGGGGTGYNGNPGGAGGSGIVIIKYTLS